MSELLNAKELAQHLKVTPATVHAWHRRGWIPCLRAGRRPVLFDVAAVEQLFFGRNITTAINVGQARGVMLLALANANIPIAEYSPPKIKEAVSGYGNASKEQIQFMVQNLLGLDEIPKPDDAADGLAVALTHYQQSRHEMLYGEG